MNYRLIILNARLTLILVLQIAASLGLFSLLASFSLFLPKTEFYVLKVS